MILANGQVSFQPMVRLHGPVRRLFSFAQACHLGSAVPKRLARYGAGVEGPETFYSSATKGEGAQRRETLRIGSPSPWQAGTERRISWGAIALLGLGEKARTTCGDRSQVSPHVDLSRRNL